MTAVARPGRGCRNGQHGRPRPVAGGTTIANLVRYQKKVGNLGRQYLSPLGAQPLRQPGSGPCAAFCFIGFRHGERHDESLVKAVRKMDLSSWLPCAIQQQVRLRRPHHGDPWTVAGFPRPEDEGGHPRRRPRVGAVPDIEHAESGALVEGVFHGVKAVALDCVLRFWSPSRPVHQSPGPRIPLRPWWQTI